MYLDHEKETVYLTTEGKKENKEPKVSEVPKTDTHPLHTCYQHHN